MRDVQVYDMTHADEVIRECNGMPTLQARMGTGGNQVPLLCEPIFLDRESFASSEHFARKPGIYEDGVAPTLIAAGPGAVCMRRVDED